MEHKHEHNHDHKPPASLKNMILAIEGIIRAAQEVLLHKYGINHATLQILPVSAGKMVHCEHCN
jgi:hypothetical protein